MAVIRGGGGGGDDDVERWCGSFRESLQSLFCLYWKHCA